MDYQHNPLQEFLLYMNTHEAEFNSLVGDKKHDQAIKYSIEVIQALESIQQQPKSHELTREVYQSIYSQLQRWHNHLSNIQQVVAYLLFPFPDGSYVCQVGNNFPLVEIQNSYNLCISSGHFTEAYIAASKAINHLQIYTSENQQQPWKSILASHNMGDTNETQTKINAWTQRLNQLSAYAPKPKQWWQF